MPKRRFDRAVVVAGCNDVVSHERGQMGLPGRSDHARPPPPCGMAKVLCRFIWLTSAPMKPGEVVADLRVEVGAVHRPDRRCMDDGADVHDRLPRTRRASTGRWHQAGEVAEMLLRLLALRSATSTLPLSSQSTTTTFILHIQGRGRLVPCADFGIRQILRWPSPQLRDSGGMAPMPAYSPCAPEFDCMLMASKPVTVFSQSVQPADHLW